MAYPPSLFKYLHPDRTDVLRDATIRFSSPKVLNDPFELKPHISALARPNDLLQQMESRFPEQCAISYRNLPALVQTVITPETYQAIARGLVLPEAKRQIEPIMTMLVVPKLRSILEQVFDKLIGILCLTESPTSLLMWAHYADGHQGFVVELDPESPFFDQRLGPEDDLRHLRKVIYRDERPALVLTEVTDFSPFLTKGQDWSYETEWRMMMPLAKASRTIDEGPTAVHLFAFPRSMVRRVIFGCRMADSKKTEIRQIIHATPQYKDVYFAEAQIDETRYRLLVTDECRAAVDLRRGVKAT